MYTTHPALSPAPGSGVGNVVVVAAGNVVVVAPGNVVVVEETETLTCADDGVIGATAPTPIARTTNPTAPPAPISRRARSILRIIILRPE